MTDNLTLSHLGFEVSDLAAWETFATQVLGLTVARRGADGAFSLRMDGHAQRLWITPGPRDDLSFVGFEVDDGAALEARVAHVQSMGVDVAWAEADEAAARDVARLARFKDLNGVQVELVCGAARATGPFASEALISRFVADDLGLGHVVMRARDRQQSVDFYAQALGFVLSDRITCEIGGYPVDITFMHAASGPGRLSRHHSLAFGEKLPKRLHHFMLEVAVLDDVGRAYDRTVDHRHRITQTIGRHPNDRMVSFYALTPSGFEFEYGWGGLQVNDEVWESTTYDHISEWGHRRPPYPRPRD